MNSLFALSAICMLFLIYTNVIIYAYYYLLLVGFYNYLLYFLRDKEDYICLIKEDVVLKIEYMNDKKADDVLLIAEDETN